MLSESKYLADLQVGFLGKKPQTVLIPIVLPYFMIIQSCQDELGIKCPLEYLQATTLISLLFIYMIPIDCKLLIFLILVLFVFCRCQELFLLSTYTSKLGSELELPTFLDIGKEVTEDKEYSLYKLSQSDSTSNDNITY